MSEISIKGGVTPWSQQRDHEAMLPGNENARPEKGRELTPPVSGNTQRDSISTSHQALSQAMVETSEDVLFAELSNGSDDVELVQPREKLSKSTIYSVLNNLNVLMLQQKGNYLDGLQHKLEVFGAAISAFSQQLKEKLDALMKELESVTGELEGAETERNGLIEQAKGYKDNIEALKAQLLAMRESGVSEDDPELQALLSKITATEDALMKLDTPLQNAINRFNALTARALELQGQINSEMEKALGNTLLLPFADQDRLEQVSKELKTSAHRLIAILNSRIEFNSRLAMEQAEDQLKRAEFNSKLTGEKRVEQAKKAEEQAEKAEASAKKSNCISKIIGYVVAAVSVALTVATGGLASPLAAIMIGLTVADVAGQAATGKSFIGAALDPLMKHVLAPIMEAITKAVGFLMEHSGLKDVMSAEAFETLKSIVSAVVTVAAVIAMSFVVKNAGALMGKMNFAKTIMDAATRHAAKLIAQITKNLPKVMKSMGQNIKHISNKLTVTNHNASLQAADIGTKALGTAGMVQQSYFNTELAIKEEKNVRARHDVEAFNKFLKDANIELDRIAELISAMQDETIRLMESVKRIMNSSTQTNLNILGMPLKAV